MDDELQAILDKQKKLADMAVRLQSAPDIQTLLEWVQQLEQEAAALEARALAWGAKMDAQYKGKEVHGRIEVMLTPDQKTRIMKETGVSMESVVIDDPSGLMNQVMESAYPPDVYPYALEQARNKGATEAAAKEARRSVDNQLAYLESISPEMAENVRRLKQDPVFQQIMSFGDKKK